MAKNKNAVDYSCLFAGNRQKEEQQAFLNSEAQALAELYLRGELVTVVHRAEGLLRQYPSWGFGWKVLSGSCALLGQNDQALAAANKAVQFLPRDPEVLNNQGNILKDLWRLTEARTAYEKAVRLKPDFAVAYNNLANVLKNQGKIAEAIRCYEKALKIDPDFVVAFGNLLLALNYRQQQDPAQYLELHQRWAERFCAGYPPPTRSGQADPEKRLVIGYLSADLGRHPVGIFMTPVLQRHNRENFTVHCYSTRTAEDDYSALLKTHCDVWRNVAGLSNEELAGVIRADGIDILVDLGGHTQSNRLPVFAMKPAPVQVTWLGYPGTTGLAAIDYRLTDDLADPPGESDGYATEKLVRLPHGFLCFPRPNTQVAARDLTATARGYVTFGSFNFLPKVTEQAIALWAAVLKAVANSRLVLKSPPLADAETAQRILKLFKAAGVTKDRIDFLGATSSYKDHLLAYNGIDIALDTFPYNGTTTIFEALWMGVPVITLTGGSHVARVGTSILARLGLNELIAGDEAEYLQKACALATDPDRLGELHLTLRERLSDSSFCDAPRFTASLEDAFRQMWQEYCRTAAA